MKQPIAICVLVALTLVPTVRSSNAELTGCSDPHVVANALTKVLGNQWSITTVQQLMSMWPNHFDELSCQTEAGCRLFVTKDRVISGHCECCQAFLFSRDQGQSSTTPEHLKNIVIHYTATSKSDGIDAERILAEGSGLKLSEVATVGQTSSERHEWSDDHAGKRQSYILEMQLTPVSNNWEVYLSITVNQE